MGSTLEARRAGSGDAASTVARKTAARDQQHAGITGVEDKTEVDRYFAVYVL